MCGYKAIVKFIIMTETSRAVSTSIRANNTAEVSFILYLLNWSALV